MVLQYLDIGLSKGFSQNLNGYIHFGNQKNHLEIAVVKYKIFKLMNKIFLCRTSKYIVHVYLGIKKPWKSHKYSICLKN